MSLSFSKKHAFGVLTILFLGSTASASLAPVGAAFIGLLSFAAGMKLEINSLRTAVCLNPPTSNNVTLVGAIAPKYVRDTTLCGIFAAPQIPNAHAIGYKETIILRGETGVEIFAACLENEPAATPVVVADLVSEGLATSAPENTQRGSRNDSAHFQHISHPDDLKIQEMKKLQQNYTGRCGLLYERARRAAELTADGEAHRPRSSTH